jgi:hypothetical protein
MNRIRKLLNSPVILGAIVPALVTWAVTALSIARYA